MRKGIIAKILLIFTYFFGFITNIYADQVRIGFLLDSLQEQRYVLDKTFLTRYTQEQQAELIIESSSGNADKQIENATKLLSQGVQVLIVQAIDAASASKIVSLAKQQHVPIIAYDRFIDSKDVALYVTHDNKLIGTLQAEKAFAAMGKIGGAVICMGPKGNSVAEQISSQNEKVLRQHGIPLIAKVSHNHWAAEECKATIVRLIAQKKHFNIVLANNSSLAAGAVDALQTLRKSTKVFVAGADGTTEACRLIMSGKQQFDVIKSIADIARITAKAAYNLAKKSPVNSTAFTKGVPTLLSQNILGFDADNIRQVLVSPVAEGFDTIFAKCDMSKL